MLSFMAKDYFGEHELLFLPLAALVIFVTIFAVVTIRALKADRGVIDALAGLPLVDDTPAAGAPPTRKNPQ